MLLMNEDHSNARARRIAEAIENGPLSMSEIADKLDVARTSVLNWKRRGSINLDNLKGLAQLTGYRFWWLAFGEGPKNASEDAASALEQSPIAQIAKASPEHARLVECIAHLTAAQVLTPALAEGLTMTLNAVASAKKE